MNRERIKEILLSPDALTYASDYPIVKELTENFPYFPTPHIILSKLLQQENSIYFDKSLKMSAAYIGNRVLLYNYLQAKPENPVSETLEVNNHQEEREIAPEPITEAQVIEDKPEAMPEIPEIVLQEPAQENVPDKELFSYQVYDYFGQYYKKEKTELAENKPPETDESNIEKLIAAPHSFSEWLDVLESIKHKTGPEIEKKEVPEINKTDHISLIDKFIKTEPRIKPQQTKMYNPEDMARKSAKEDFSMATETLANIFLKQGLKHKAIEIFQQLILKYPQKSGYFAAKIREIESESLS